jgi:hypothetical protein
VGRGDIVKESGVVQYLQPVRLWEVSVGEHGPNFVQESAVQAFCHAVMLWHVGSGDFVLDASLLKKLLDMTRHIFAPSVGAEDLHLLSYFQLGPSDECFEHFANLRLFL